VPLAGIIRRDNRVPEAIRRQTPLLTRHPGSAAAGDAARLAEGLLG
jgi:flagellar biosynthesis protein FlhG